MNGRFSRILVYVLAIAATCVLTTCGRSEPQPAASATPPPANPPAPPKMPDVGIYVTNESSGEI